MEKLKRVVIKEEFVALTGDEIKALILNQFIYWSERVKDFDKFIEEEKRRAETENQEVKIELTNGWIYKSAKELKEEIMVSVSPLTIRRHLEYLIKKEWINERQNPKYKWDRTKQYRVNLHKIQQDLLKIGYTLQDYKEIENLILSNSKLTNGEDKKLTQISKKNVPIVHPEPSIVQNEPLKVQNELLKVQNEPLKVQNEPAIPEITTDITTDITTEKNKKNFSEKNNKLFFSGKRAREGVFVSKEGVVVNAGTNEKTSSKNEEVSVSKEVEANETGANGVSGIRGASEDEGSGGKELVVAPGGDSKSDEEDVFSCIEVDEERVRVLREADKNPSEDIFDCMEEEINRGLEKAKRFEEAKNEVGGGVKELLRYFGEKFEEKFNLTYPANFGKDGKILKDLLKIYSEGQIKQLMDLFFRSEDGFIQKAGYSVGVFKSCLPKLISEPFGRHTVLIKWLYEMTQKAAEKE